MSDNTTPIKKDATTTTVPGTSRGVEHQEKAAKNELASKTDPANEATTTSDSDIKRLKKHFNSDEYQRED